MMNNRNFTAPDTHLREPLLPQNQPTVRLLIYAASRLLARISLMDGSALRCM